MADFKNISIRCPLELVRAVEALMAQRKAENPYQIPSAGAVYRELLTRGLESVAAEAAGGIVEMPKPVVSCLCANAPVWNGRCINCDGVPSKESAKLRPHLK